ncbi:sensor histidine kinase [Parasynechococcus sp.]|uniref:sensor histidine kinase n=1 Tax=Parasynechococcus sp. TaxID=3101203 RepID=UPI00370470EA
MILSALIGLIAGATITRWWNRRQHRVRLELIQATERLEKGLSAPQLLAWIDAATQGWIILAPDLSIAYLNARAERLLQISQNRLVRGMALEQVLSVPQLNEAIISTRYSQLSQRSEWDQNGSPLEGLVLPGSEEWLLILLQSRQSLEAQQQEQERWVSDVAHELRTPLTALMLVSERLEMAVTGQDQDMVLVQRLQKELRRLQVLVEDLLELSRLENSLPQDSEKYSALTLEDLVDSAWNSVRPLAEARDIELELDRKESGQLMGDLPRLHRAVVNLLDNALRYSPNGSTVDVQIHPSGGWWQLSIRDHGPGLSDADLDKMFQRFYRGDPSRARSTRSGSGLGLAIVQQIAVVHGGRVEARNHPEGGTCMELTLPRVLTE